MLKQKELIANVKNLTESDERITACMMYGSFTKGEGKFKDRCHTLFGCQSDG